MYVGIGSGALVLLLIIIAVSSKDSPRATPVATQNRGRDSARRFPQPQQKQTSHTRSARQRDYTPIEVAPFVDDGKWRGYIQESLPTNPTTEQGQALFERVQDLSYYGQNLTGADRRAIYLYLISLCEACTTSPHMSEEWKSAFSREAGGTRRLLTHE